MYLVGAHDDRLLTVLHVIFDLQYAVDPQPVPRPSLQPQQQDARTILFRLRYWKLEIHITLFDVLMIPSAVSGTTRRLEAHCEDNPDETLHCNTR
ncbi:unnamed protein product, partial [Timema podura]|nr:unnamed protein product [Timema podura]